MKLLIAATVVALSGCAASAQQPPPLEIVKIHEAPGKSKAEVCRTARDWVALTFKDSKAVVEVYDLEAGTMIGKGRVILLGFGATPFPTDFTIQVDCKDGRARSTYSGFMTNSSGMTYPLKEDSMNNLRSKAAARIAELDLTLGTRLAGNQADQNW